MNHHSTSQQKQPKFTADSHVASKVIVVIQASSRRVVSFNSMAPAHVPWCYFGQLVMSQLKGLALHVLDVEKNGHTEPCSQDFNFWSLSNCFIDRRISRETCRNVNFPAVHITEIDLHSTEGKWNLMTCNFQVFWDLTFDIPEAKKLKTLSFAVVGPVFGQLRILSCKTINFALQLEKVFEEMTTNELISNLPVPTCEPTSEEDQFSKGGCWT